MCDDMKWSKPVATSSGKTGAKQPRGGKSSGIKDMKVCPRLDRTKWCQKLPRGHDEGACHDASQRRREVIKLMKQLVDAHVDSPVCPEWDTSETCENTRGPYRFGVVQPSANNDNYKIIYSQLTKGCECIKRNGLQDDCRLPRCQGSPACRTTPFPTCEPFLGIPEAPSKTSPGKYDGYFSSGEPCKCPSPAPVGAAGNKHLTGRSFTPLDISECLCVCR